MAIPRLAHGGHCITGGGPRIKNKERGDDGGVIRHVDELSADGEGGEGEEEGEGE